jgi:hypothetical protein
MRSLVFASAGITGPDKSFPRNYIYEIGVTTPAEPAKRWPSKTTDRFKVQKVQIPRTKRTRAMKIQALTVGDDRQMHVGPKP